jgi:Domain of unknown function (DU1801)
MAEPKTKKSRASVAAFLAAVPDPERRKDARAVAALLRRVTGERAALWGTNIVGFGTYHYRYASGREGDWPVAAFAPRADRISVYVTCDLSRHRELLARLGKHSKGKGCLHIRRLSDVDPDVLEELVRSGVAEVRARYPD